MVGVDFYLMPLNRISEEEKKVSSFDFSALTPALLFKVQVIETMLEFIDWITALKPHDTE